MTYVSELSPKPNCTFYIRMSLCTANKVSRIYFVFLLVLLLTWCLTLTIVTVTQNTMSSALLTKLQRVLAATLAKVKEEQRGETSPVTEEYRSMERASTLGPPWEQHDNMVGKDYIHRV